MTEESTCLDGAWSVRRVSGVLPPRVTKRIDGATGCTSWFGVPVGRFAVVEPGPGARVTELRYRRWPVVDRIQLEAGTWTGDGRVFGVRFCRFRLCPSAARTTG